MSRLSRHLLNVTLLLIAVSGQFNLTDFIEVIGLQKDIERMISMVFHTVLNIVLYFLISGIHNIQGLGSPVKAVSIAALWLTSGYPCEFCDKLYEAYQSGPSDSITDRLWHFVSTPEHVISYIVVSFSVLRLISQWGVFYYFFKTHESPDIVKTKKRNCTTIISTADTERQGVEECLTSCLLNKVREVIVVTTSDELAETEDMVNRFHECFPETAIRVLGTEETRKCDMISEAIKIVETDIVVLVDSNVFWPRRFLDRLLVSFGPTVGFAIIHQRIRRFKLPFFEVSPRVGNTQLEPRIGLTLGEYAARAIACPKALFQHREFSTSFKRAQPRDSASYDEESAALFLERWALEKGYHTAKGYAGHDAFEPPARTTPESAVWTHRLFYCVRYARQAGRMKFRNSLNIATEWRNMPSAAYGSHALAYLLLAFCLDAALALIIWASPRKTSERLKILGGVYTGYPAGKQLPYFIRGELLMLETMWYPVFVWFHGLLKKWAVIYLCLNLFGETGIDIENKPPMTVIGNRNDTDMGSSSSGPDSGTSNSRPDVSSVQTQTEWVDPNELDARSEVQNEPMDNEALNRTSTTPIRTNDPIQRVRNSPSYRPASVPLSPRQRIQNDIHPSIEQLSRAQTPSPISQALQESPRSLPNTPIERSQLREEITQDIKETSSGLSSPPSSHEQQPWSRSPSPRTETPNVQSQNLIQPQLGPTPEPPRFNRRNRTARQPTSYDDVFNPSESESSFDGCSSGQESHADPVAESPPRFRTPNFTPSQPVSRAATPIPALATVPALPMPRQSLQTQRIPVKTDPVREMSSASTMQGKLEPTPQLRAPRFTKSKPTPAAAFPAPRSPAKPKAKRAAPKPAVVSPRKTRCSKCRRLHEGECLEE